MAKLEIFDGTNWIQLGGTTNIALTGAVTGSGSGSIVTTLNNYQTMIGSTLSFNWSNNGQFQEYSNYHTLQDSNPPPHFVHLVQSGSGSTYRRWLTVYKPGFGSQPTGSYEINFYHAANGFQYPFKIDTYGSTLRTYFGTIVDMQNNEIINLLSPTTTTSAATKGYVDLGRVPIGGEITFPKNATIPVNFLKCDGSIVTDTTVRTTGINSGFFGMLQASGRTTYVLPNRTALDAYSVTIIRYY